MEDEKKKRGFRVRLTPTARGRSGAVGIYKVRPSRRVGPSWIAPLNSRHDRYVTAKVVKVNRSDSRGARAITNEVKYAAKEGPLFQREGGGIGEASPKALIDEWQYDKLLYHVIVAPNDGDKLTDLNGFAKATLEYWETRTGPLQAVWSVEEKPDACHPEGNRHFHFLVRGEQDGRDLEFSAHMIRRSFREGAREAATDQLGYMTVRECQQLERRMDERKWQKEREREDRDEERSL